MKEQIPSCKELHHHAERTEYAQKSIPSDTELFALADFYKIFGDSTRIKILYVLHETELCVCDIADLLGMQISAISHQLRILKQARLVKFRRSGKTVYYALADDHIHAILAQGMEHISEEK